MADVCFKDLEDLRVWPRSWSRWSKWEGVATLVDLDRGRVGGVAVPSRGCVPACLALLGGAG